MFKMRAIYLLSVVLVLTNCVHEEVFKSDLNYPKCCPKGQHLSLDSHKNVTCARKHKHLYLTFDVTTHPLKSFPEDCNEKCVDALKLNDSASNLVEYNCMQKTYQNLAGYVAYPKCCPLDRRYDLKRHKCVALGQPIQVANSSYLTIGIQKCTGSDLVITDHKKSPTSISKDRVLELDGVEYDYGYYCLDQDAETGDEIVRTCGKYRNVCKHVFEEPGIPCFKKCCPDGQAYWKKMRTCAPTFNDAIQFSVEHRFRGINDSNFNYGLIYPGRIARYLPTEEHKFYIDKWGTLHIREFGVWKPYSSQDATYCLDTLANEENSTDVLFLFFPRQTFDKVRFTMIAVVISISAAALFLTFLGYLMLPEMQNLFGKLVMTYCLVHGVGFSLLAWSQINYDSKYCTIVGFMIQFSMLAVFSWLSVICFHMWTAFGQFRINTESRKGKNRKILFFYNLFAWSYPTFWVIFTLVSWYTNFLPPNFTPKLGINHCFFEKYAGTYDFLIFFVIPESILVITNTIFYVKTVYYCTKVKREINEMKDNVNEKSRRKNALLIDRENLYMLLKLGFVMGVNWVFELLTSVVTFRNDQFLEWVECFFDFFNCAQGIFIFCIFMLKKKVLVSIKKRLGIKIAQTSSECSTSVSNLYNNKHSTDITTKPNKVNGHIVSKAPEVYIVKNTV